MNILKIMDTRTLAIIYMMVQLVVTCVFITSVFVYKKKYLNTITVGFVIGSIGAYLISSQNADPFISVILANSCIILGLYIINKGLLEIVGVDFKVRLIVGIMIFHVTYYIFFTYVNPLVNLRVAVFTLEQIIPAMFVIYFYFKDYLKNREIYKISIVIISLFYILAIIPRAISIMFSDTVVVLFQNKLPLQLMLSYTIFYLISRGFIIILIAAKELEDELMAVNSELEHLSYIDHLTSIYNNRAIMEKLKEEIVRTKRYKVEMAIAIIDLDNFKIVNDTYGHVFGDDVLRHFSHTAKEELREMDKIGRYGGEEFLLVLPETNKEDAKLVLERIKSRFKKIEWHVNCKPISFSSGIIEINESNLSMSVRSLIDKADQALYSAKEKGKDRIEIYD